MNPKDLKQAERQGELRLVKRAEANDVPLETVRRQKTPGAAFTLACSSSGLEDKEIYGAINVDAGTFSRIKSGTATLQGDDLVLFCHVVNNRIYPEWLAYQLGCTLVQIQSEAERQLAEERMRREAVEAENKVLRDLFKRAA